MIIPEYEPSIFASFSPLLTGIAIVGLVCWLIFMSTLLKRRANVKAGIIGGVCAVLTIAGVVAINPMGEVQWSHEQAEGIMEAYGVPEGYSTQRPISWSLRNGEKENYFDITEKIIQGDDGPTRIRYVGNFNPDTHEFSMYAQVEAGEMKKLHPEDKREDK